MRRQVRTSLVWLSLLSVAVLATIALLVVVWFKATDANTRSCTVQDRGLHAQPYLLGYLYYLERIASLPEDASTKQRLAALPPAERKRDLGLLYDLNWDLKHYLRIEDKQPRSRNC